MDGNGGSSGLVSSSKTKAPLSNVVNESGLVEIDQKAARIKRMRKSILGGAGRHMQEVRESGCKRGRWALVTVTYREDEQWKPSQIRGLVRHCRKWLSRRGHPLRFVWCLELTKRLRPHYHLLVYVPAGLTLPKPDKQRWWTLGMSKIETARNAVGYIAKYQSKASPAMLEALPKGARLHGLGGLSRESARCIRYDKAPSFVQKGLGKLADIRKVLGGYADKCSGVFLRSPWHVHFGAKGRIFVWSDETCAF